LRGQDGDDEFLDVQRDESTLFWKICQSSGVPAQSHGYTVHVVELGRIRGLDEWGGKNGAQGGRGGAS
jgi:hypothetical protein